MNATLMAQNAYTTATTAIKTPRSIELDVFSRVTRRLSRKLEETNYPEFARALHENRHLWTLLAVDVADPDNGLPQDLRARLFYLAEFTLQHTSKVLAGTASVDILHEINSSVMRGLRQQGETR